MMRNYLCMEKFDILIGGTHLICAYNFVKMETKLGQHLLMKNVIYLTCQFIEERPYHYSKY